MALLKPILNSTAYRDTFKKVVCQGAFSSLIFFLWKKKKKKRKKPSTRKKHQTLYVAAFHVPFTSSQTYSKWNVYSVGVTHLCTVLPQISRVDVWSLFRSNVRRLHHVSIIPQFNTTEGRLENKRHFHQRLGGGDEGKKNGSLQVFQTYQFHVNGHWNAKILAWLFPTRFLSFSPSLFFLFVHLSLSVGSGSWTWYAKLPVVSVVPLATYCKLVNSRQTSERDLTSEFCH